MIKPELLLPAGDLTKAKTAINFGADAIYLGAKAYSLRARASNFDFSDVKEISDYVHKRKKK
jgi:putative protease